jgi:hypothetical protein
MDEEPWHVKRKRELEEVAPIKRKKLEPFIKVPRWWIAAAARAVHSPATIVLMELLHASWKAKSLTFPVPNGRLQRLGVNRETKRRVLVALEAGGLIKVERSTRKSPVVTLLSL